MAEETFKMLMIKELIRQSRPFGQAFVVALLVTILMWLIHMVGTPSEKYLLVEATTIPEHLGVHWEGDDPIDEPLQIDALDCRWKGRSNASHFSEHYGREPSSDTGFHYLIECRIEQSNTAGGNSSGQPLALSHFRNSSDWHLSGFGFAFRAQDQKDLSGPMLAIYISLPMVIALLLIRGLAWREDIGRASRALSRAPFLILAAPAAVMLTGAMILAISGTGHEPMESNPFPLYGIPMLLVMILVSPFFEEAVFRQWLYERTKNSLPPVTAGIASSWFFMLAHLFNPQTGRNPGYLLVVMVLGGVLFWIRHRYQSFSLAAIAHSINNGIFLIPAYLLG